MTATATIIQCRHCSDTGKATVPNGPDDYDVEYCGCPSGERLMREHAETARQYLIEGQKKLCDQIKAPFFAPNDGMCYFCKKDCVHEGWLVKHITGCNRCMMSFTD